MKNTALPVTLIFLILLSLSLTAKAESQFSVAPSLLHFDYTEFDTTDSVLDSETGWIPGVQLQFDTNLSEPWTVGFEVSVYDGNIGYDGQTQTGVPHTTTTDEQIFRLGAFISTPANMYTSLVIGGKYHEWERDINDNNGISGLLEIYSWWEISAGATIEFWKKETGSWQFEVSLLKILDPRLHVDLSRVNAGKTNLNLGTDWGGRFKLTWMQQMNANSHISFNLFHEIWDFGRSDVKATSGGANSFFILEPRSETRHTGIQLLVGFNY